MARRRWQPLFNSMTRVQKLVHLAYRRDSTYIREMGDSLFHRLRDAYQETLRREAIAIGCPDPGPVWVNEGPGLSALRQRADWAAESVANTYNYDLAVEIHHIRQETPTANRNVYAFRLLQWETERARWKNPQISLTETFWAINYAKEEFHRFNVIDVSYAEIRPFNTVCPICAELVSANPYPSVAAIFVETLLPVHANCPHYAHAVVGTKPTTMECKDLWLG